MSLFIESIKYHQGKLWNLTHHQARFEATRQVFFPEAPSLNLQKKIEIPQLVEGQMYKCRVVYGEHIERIEFIPYQAKSLKSLKIIEADHIDYRYKSLHRAALDALYLQKAEADDVLIVKNGKITDSSYANVAFYDGQRWYTPAYPLLRGTQRAFLLAEKIIEEADISPYNLQHFTSIKIFNALMDWEFAPEIKISGLRT